MRISWCAINFPSCVGVCVGRCVMYLDNNHNFHQTYDTSRFTRFQLLKRCKRDFHTFIIIHVRTVKTLTTTKNQLSFPINVVYVNIEHNNTQIACLSCQKGEKMVGWCDPFFLVHTFWYTFDIDEVRTTYRMYAYDAMWWKFIWDLSVFVTVRAAFPSLKSKWRS